jgi:pimeloyl-ACP methyl ester carboxylesterase
MAVTPKWAPEPPVELPPGRVEHVRGRGELFIRDSGGDGRPVLLLHGWMFSADLNFWRNYDALARGGYRVLAVDHRGHGRGLRSHARFTLADCAHDAAALLPQIGAAPALIVGYSMGGPIAQLMARDHPETVAGVVLCATSSHWTDVRQRVLWRSLAVLRLVLGLTPDVAWRRGLRLAGFPDSPVTTWTTSELTRGSAVDLAEAGRELSNWDSRSWLGGLAVPAAVVVTTRDGGVPPDHQRELAALLGAPTFDVEADHGAAISAHRPFNAALLAALQAVAEPATAVAA